MWFVAAGRFTEKVRADVGDKHMKTAPRGRTPEPHFFC